MKRRLLSLTVGLLLAGGLIPAPILAGGSVIDQHLEGPGNELWGMGTAYHAQSFTVGITGNLTGVSLWIFCTNTTHVDVNIHPVNASGYPTGAYLVSSWSGVTSHDGWAWFAMTPVSVTAGQKLAMVIHPVGPCQIRGWSGNRYAGGMASFNGSGNWHPVNWITTQDFDFRTNVMPAWLIQTPPPPAPPQPPSVHTPAPAVPPTASPTPAAQTEAPTSTPALTEAPLIADASASDASASAANASAANASAQSASAACGSAASASAASASAACGSATPSAANGGSGDSSGPPIVAIAAGIVVLGGLGGLLGFLVLRRRRSPEEARPPAPGGGGA